MVENPDYLISLQKEIDKLILTGETFNENPEVYKVLKEIIEEKLSEETFRGRFEEINDFVISMAQLDFSKSLSLGERKDLFSYVASSLNLLNEELRAKVVSNNFVQTLIDKNGKSVILIDKAGKIIFANTQVRTLLNFSEGDLRNKHISMLLDKEFCFTLSDCWGERTVSIEIRNQSNELIPVTLNALPINNENTIDGFMLEFVPL